MPLIDLMKVGTRYGRIKQDTEYDKNTGFTIHIGYTCQGDNPDQWCGSADGYKEKHDELCKCGGTVSKIRDTYREDNIWNYVEKCAKEELHPVFNIHKWTAWYVKVTDEHIKGYESSIIDIWSIFYELDEKGILYVVDFDGWNSVQNDFYMYRPITSKTKSAAKTT